MHAHDAAVFKEKSLRLPICSLYVPATSFFEPFASSAVRFAMAISGAAFALEQTAMLALNDTKPYAPNHDI